MQSYMLHSICAWKSDIPISQLKLLTGTPPEVRVPTLKLGGAATTLTSKFKMAIQCISSKWNWSNILFFSNSVWFCVALNSHRCTQYYPIFFFLWTWYFSIKSMQNNKYFMCFYQMVLLTWMNPSWFPKWNAALDLKPEYTHIF